MEGFTRIPQAALGSTDVELEVEGGGWIRTVRCSRRETWLGSQLLAALRPEHRRWATAPAPGVGQAQAEGTGIEAPPWLPVSHGLPLPTGPHELGSDYGPRAGEGRMLRSLVPSAPCPLVSRIVVSEATCTPMVLETVDPGESPSPGPRVPAWGRVEGLLFLVARE